MFGSTDIAEFLIRVFDENPAAVKVCSSAVSVVYDLGFDLDIGSPHSPHRGDGTATLVRRAATFDKPAPKLMDVCWDLAIVKRWLMARGPLRDQSFRDLTHSAIVIARAFHALRGADLHAMAQTKNSALDRITDETIEPVNIMLWMTKTATRTCKEQNYWRVVSFAPLRVRQMTRGLKISIAAARMMVESCCLLRALAELRRRVMPVVRLAQTMMVGGKEVWATSFFLMPSTRASVEGGVHSIQPKKSKRGSDECELKYMALNSFNPIVKKVHESMVQDGMPQAVKGATARHYRHVALTLMHRVGCTQEARDLSTHAEGSMTYAKSYCIPHIDPDFEKRFQDLDGSAAFAQLRACERLLL